MAASARRPTRTRARSSSSSPAKPTSTSRACAPSARRGRTRGSASTPTRATCPTRLHGCCPRSSSRSVSLLEQPLQARPRGRSGRHRPRRCRSPPTKASWGWTNVEALRRPVRRRQHQARQVRRPDRRPADGRSARASLGPEGDGRQHGRHQPGDGAGVRARPALRHRRPRRPDLPGDATARRACVYDDGTGRLPPTTCGARRDGVL